MMMTVQIKPGLWKRRDGVTVTVWPFQDGGWMGSDGWHRWDDGLYASGTECELDLVEFIGEPEPQPQPDAAEELAALRDDRDRWQARAKQAEGYTQTLQREAREQRERMAKMDQGWAALQQQLTTSQIQLREAEQQLEAAAHSPDLRSDLERVARERDAAREEVRGLQVRAEQAEGDARQANGKLGHVEGEVVQLKAQLTIKTDTLTRAEAAVDALQVVILNLFERLRNDD